MTESIDQLKQAATNGDINAMTTLAKQLIANPESADSAQQGQVLLKQAVDGGSAEAAEFVSIMFAAGLLGQPDWNNAFDFLAMAASLGKESARRQMYMLSGNAIDEATLASNDHNWRALREQINIEALLATPAPNTVCSAPRIFTFDQFIPHAMCNWLIAKARPDLTRARTYDDADSEGKETDARTNSSVMFGLLELDLVLLLVQSRISKMLDVPMLSMEKPMVFHYAQGEEFREHVDYLDPSKPAHRADIDKYGQRVATFLIYLNEDFSGAETYFPAIEQKVRCDKGGAVLFHSIDHQGNVDPDSRHAGLTPIDGEKWLFSQWIRVRANYAR